MVELTETSLPLWVWIVIIVVASLVIIGTTAFTIRCLVVRRRVADFDETFGENLPQRRVTVRRGKIVDQNKYLSLTGSKFGVNTFNTDDADSRAGARSKSPFEWWSTFKERPQIRNSQMSQISTTNQTMRSEMTASPEQSRIYQRRDLNYSSTSLNSSVTGKDNETTVSVTEDEPTSPTVRSFSRPFSQQQRYSGYGMRVRALSRIDEASPHASMISTARSRTASMLTDKRDTRCGPSPLNATPDVGETIQRPAPIYGLDSARPMNHAAYGDMPSSPLIMDPAKNTTYESPRSGRGNEQHRRKDSADSCQSQGRASMTSNRSRGQVTALPQAPPESMSNHPHSLTPQRSTSFKKGKVLRKKSQKKADAATMQVGS